MSVVLIIFPEFFSIICKYPFGEIVKIMLSIITGLKYEFIFCLQFTKPKFTSNEKKELSLFEKYILFSLRTRSEFLTK